MRKMSPIRFVVAAALAGILAAAGFGLTSTVTQAFADQRERIDASLRLLAVYRAQAAMRPRLEKRLKEIHQTAASLPGLMMARNGTVAAAQLQGELQAIVQRNRGQTRQTQILPATFVNGFEQVTVKGQLNVPITSLRDIVYGVETHSPYFYIDRLTITGPREWPADNKPGPEPRLQIEWTVHAFRRSAAS